MQSFLDLSFSKNIGRLSMGKLRGSERTTISKTHLNGSDEVVGCIDLDDLEGVVDLYYALSRLIENHQPRGTP